MNKISIVFIGICIFLSACKKKNDDPSAVKQADRLPLVSNIGYNVIFPRYLNLQTSFNDFDSEVQLFTASPSIDGLKTLRTKFYKAYIDWEYVAQFEFGPAISSTAKLQTEYVNAFPSDTTLIKSKIAAGVTSISFTGSASYSGFPAIDYLLYGKSLTDQQIVDSFSVSLQATKRCDFFKAISSNLKTRISDAYKNWTSLGANYVAIYTSNVGLDQGSSTALTVNRMIADLETVTNYKLGLPLNISQNVVVDNTIVNPFKCEAYHSDSSLVFTKTSIEAIRRLYLGITKDGVDAVGFDDYLKAIDQTQLNAKIQNQILLVQKKLNEIPAPISIAIQNPAGKKSVQAAYTEMVNLLTLFKGEFASTIGVVISY